MGKSPAFQFYPKDWLSSRKARRMTPEERGGYIDLLAHSWLEDDCSLPDNDDELAFLSGLNDRWPECSQAIRKCFEKRGNKLFNLRLLMEVRKQEAFRKQCSDAGKRSAEVRKNKELAKVGATSVQPEGQGRCNSSSLSLSLSSSLSSITSSKKTKDKDSARFKKPSLEEVRQYITEKGYDIDPETFIAHYESNGWKVGRNAMKSWKSACVTWSKNPKKDEGKFI
ncbi:hypothetical protein LCGC14_1403030 [marine sediment metagenome]|uniref:DUF1376 domain-containing protein n=1 Tax=marine sediment metagenome TaxID=412755 RepID=A0A0F9JWR5_9ZZZZ